MLDPIVDTLDSIPEAFRSAYREGTKDEGAEGKFVLSVKKGGDWTLENTKSLRNALAQAKDERTQAKAALEKFSGLDSADVRTRLEELERLKAEGVKPGDKQKLDDAIAAARAEVEKKYTGQLKERDDALAEKDGMIEQLTRFAEIDSAIAAHGATKELIRDHLVNVTKSHPQEKGAPKTQVIDPETKLPRVSQAAGNTGDMTVDEYVASLKNHPVYSAAFRREGGQQGPGVTDRGGDKGDRPARQKPSDDVLKNNPMERLRQHYRDAGKK